MKKSFATPFAIAGALLIAALFVVMNLIVTPDTLWFIYPVFAVIWWPLGVCLCRAKHFLAFALTGSLLTIVFLAAVNILTTPHNLWFVYTVPPLLCFPAGVYFKDRMRSLGVALSFSVIIIAYYTAVNLLLTPARFWAIYPIFVTLWWPVTQFFTARKAYKAFSIVGAAMTIAFLIASNLLTTTYPWALYACFPVLLWPAAMFLVNKLKGQAFSIIAFICLVLWYGALNVFHSPGSPWIIFVAFPLLWWPLSVYFYGRHCPHIYAAVMSLISIVFFVAVNVIFAPGSIWAFYPAFALIWWPMTLMFARKRAWFAYSVAAYILTVVFLSAVNYITSPSFPWSVFPAMGMIWWPAGVLAARKKNTLGFSVFGALLVIGTLVVINLITSPSLLWSIFAALGVIWWPAGVFFTRKKSALGLSLFGALLVIGTLIAINLITSPSFLWSIFTALGILWWPAAVLFAKKKSAFGFSLVGSLLAMALLAAINFMTSPGFPWCVFPLFGILWWPLSVYFHVTRRRRLITEQKA